jgi:hypothetical protein
MKRFFGWAALGVFVLFQCGAAAAQDVDFDAQTAAGGAWHYKSVPCAMGVVSDVGPRLQSMGQTVFTAADYDSSGVSVGIRFPQPWHFLASLSATKEYIVHYQGAAGNAIMRSERAGDSVQVCLVSFPAPRIDPATHRVLCDPDKDARGLTFRVYDVRQHAAYVGPNSEHDCGGA